MANGRGLTVAIPPPTPRSPFILSSSSAASSPTGSSAGPLPFPTALPRRDFLAPDFHAPTYLSSLFPTATEADDDAAGPAPGQHALRHQTLEDLRSELRERSAAISAELLELVNANYASFLSLGDGLKGGGDRVEDVRVALLGFRRQVEEVKGRVRGRREDAGRASEELAGVRGAIETARRMLELDERLDTLERRLALGSTPGGGGPGPGTSGGDSDEDEEDEDEDEDEDDEGGFVGSSPAKLGGLAADYTAIHQLAGSLGRGSPYVRKMEERMARCRNTLLLDLGTATKEARKAGARRPDRVLKYLAVYRLLGAHAEGVQALKE